MYNCHLGRKLTSMIFLGPTYYQQLKNMVDEKIHSCGHGLVQILTYKLTEEDSHDRVLCFGDMEHDCMIAHGVSHLLIERPLCQSDAYRAHFCECCGVTEIMNLKIFYFGL